MDGSIQYTFPTEDGGSRSFAFDELFRGYGAGETPNPDVLCNEAIKFGLFMDEAKKYQVLPIDDSYGPIIDPAFVWQHSKGAESKCSDAQ